MIAAVLNSVLVVSALALIGAFLVANLIGAIAIIATLARLIVMVSSAGKPRVYTRPEPKVASPVDP